MSHGLDNFYGLLFFHFISVQIIPLVQHSSGDSFSAGFGSAWRAGHTGPYALQLAREPAVAASVHDAGQNRTIVPSEATAAISFRLVGGQDCKQFWQAAQP